MDFEAQVKSKYPHICPRDVTRIVDKAKAFYYMLRYPCEPNADEETRPIVTFKSQQWILSACDELIERLGFNSATAYKENGMSWTFDNPQLSTTLISLLTPIVGVTKRTV